MARQKKGSAFLKIKAGDIQAGDRLNYYYSGKVEGVVRVSTVDRSEHLWGKKHPESIHLQIEHPKRGRIAWSLNASVTVEKLDVHSLQSQEDEDDIDDWGSVEDAEEEDFWGEVEFTTKQQATDEDIAEWLAPPKKKRNGKVTRKKSSRTR